MLLKKVGTVGELYEGKITKRKKRNDIAVDKIPPRVLKIATLPQKIAHTYPLAPPYNGNWKRSPSFCSFASFTVTFRGE